ncbi:MAG TPA: hypothetical protein VGI93_21635 [Steroidobacteraceae bacterium]|jgi:bacterioferritin (cytochrome b1)
MGFDLDRDDSRSAGGVRREEGSIAERLAPIRLFGEALTTHLLAHRYALERYRGLRKECAEDPRLRPLLAMAIDLEEQHGRLLHAILSKLGQAGGEEIQKEFEPR